MDGERLKYGFLKNHGVLIRRLSTSSILSDVYSEGIVTNTEKEMISKQLAESTKTDKLLDIIHRQGKADPKIYCTFFELLSDDSITSGQNLESVLEQIKSDSKSDDVRNKFQYERRLLEENDRVVMIKYKSTIEKSLSVDNILPQLVSCGIVSSADKVEIQLADSQDAQALKLYNLILDRGSPAFEAFVRVLLESDKYERLGQQMHSHHSYHDNNGPSPDVVFDEYPVEEVLKRGSVPPRQGVYVERKTVLDSIRCALNHLKDKEG